MKDFAKSIRTRNSLNPEYKRLYDEKKDIENEIRLLEMDRNAWQKEKEENKDYNVKRQINDINSKIVKYQKRLSDIDHEMAKIAAGNKKTGNESIEKQEWSMFNGLAKDAEKEVGNSFEVGSHITIQQNGKEYDVKVLKDMPSKVLVKGPNGAVIEVSKTDIVKVGNETLGQWAKAKPRVINETAEEKKFGHVMREFDRGELKSSSGETVTNPEQAKAIAYSEAEKVDNLKRARNSIKKG